MGYALFANRKLVLDAQLNTAQLQQTQRSNEQYNLAVNSLGLQQQLSSNMASQSNELAALYEQLAAVGKSAQGSFEGKEGDALTAASLEYTAQRDAINAEISRKQEEHKQENDKINREIYEIGVKEQAIELEVKRLDTMVTALQQQLEAVEAAEGKSIERATPKFKGVG